MESNVNPDLLNGDGEEYTEAQLVELREYLTMLADLAIEIYAKEKQ